MTPAAINNKAPSGGQAERIRELERETFFLQEQVRECKVVAEELEGEVSSLQKQVESWRADAAWWQENSKAWHGHMMALLGTMRAREEARRGAGLGFNFGEN
jgi:FtsZ-binding cell division protein ZapB